MRTIYTFGPRCSACDGEGRVKAGPGQQPDTKGLAPCGACVGLGLVSPERYYLVESGELIPVQDKTTVGKTLVWETLRTAAGSGGAPPWDGAPWFPFGAIGDDILWRRASLTAYRGSAPRESDE